MAQPAVDYTDASLLGAPITLNNCDREPIHIPGLIQPYGFLLCLNEQTRRVVQASANTRELLGIAAEELLGQGLELLLSPETLAEVDALWPTITTTGRLLGVRLDKIAGQPFYKLILHRFDHLLWVEGEAVDAAAVSAFDLPTLNLTLSQLLAAESTLDLCQLAAQQVRDITGFDRVVVYRFEDDDSGYVLSEAVREGMGPWLGMHYPATDIPRQARAMYLKNWLRFIADASYVPVPLVPAINPSTGRPPDMTYSVLRSVSPIHLQYLHNIGSAATMTISLIDNGRLWGLIACHHETPLLISYELRDLCQFLGKSLSSLLQSRQRQDELVYRQQILRAKDQLVQQLTNSNHFPDALYQHPTTLLDLFDCGGAAICLEEDTIQLGNTPSLGQIDDLLSWLRSRPGQTIFHTDSYAQLNPAGVTIRTTASGILALSLSPEQSDYLLWFRPEQVRTVTWAGRDDKLQTTTDGQVFLSPRQSFEAWKQTVENMAVPWQPMEVEAARELRQHLIEVRLQALSAAQAEAASMARMNAELERSNEELDAFAYVASHDLKEPLRGIHNYALFLLEDYSGKLDEEGISRLQALVRLSERMEALIEGLLQLSRASRQDLPVQEIDFRQLLDEVVDMLKPRLEQTNTTVSIVLGTPPPVLRANELSLREVFGNLLSNAMRYNDQPLKRVTVGQASPDTRGPQGTGDPADYLVFFVQDNGIGISSRHHENIFKLFKRLHAPEKYGGGTGAGLAIAKKMVEKHGGELWVSSEPGQGSTFFFSLSRHL